MLAELSNFKPDAKSFTPVYLQLANKLTEVIHNGQWMPLDPLPSERVLSDKLSVSRVTARRAFDVLCERGLLLRKHGSGTYISYTPAPPVLRRTKFSEELRQKGFVPGSRWLSRTIGVATYEETLALKLAPSAQVTRLKRLRMADQVIMAVENTTIPIQFLPDPEAVSDTVYRYFEANGILPTHVQQHIHAISANAEHARIVDIDEGASMIYLNRVGYLGDGTAIEYTNSYCREDYYDFLT